MLLILGGLYFIYCFLFFFSLHEALDGEVEVLFSLSQYLLEIIKPETLVMADFGKYNETNYSS